MTKEKMNSEKKESKRIVVTGNMVVRYVGLLAGLFGFGYFIGRLLYGGETSGLNLNTQDWCIISLCLVSCFLCFYLTRKK